MNLITLRKLCELVGVSRRSIQGYENAGLMMPSSKNKWGHLLYDENALHRAQYINFLQQLGFKLKEIKEIIDAPDCMKKEAIERRIKELKVEQIRMEQIIQKAREYIENDDENVVV